MDYQHQENQREIRSISLDLHIQQKTKPLTQKSAEGAMRSILMLRGQGFWNLDKND
jgi:hypothetical protein